MSKRSCAISILILSGLLCVLLYVLSILFPLNGVPKPVAYGPDAIERIEASLSSDRPKAMTPTADKVLDEFAGLELKSWEDSAKVEAPRILLARCFQEWDAKEIEEYILQCTAFRQSGSSWGGVTRDYDFTEVTLCSLLYLFEDQPERLTPAAVDHIVNVLLVEKGAEPRLTAPKSLGLVYDTENHLLMTEGSRYLRNQWLYTHGEPSPELDNENNRLGQWLAEYLNGIYRYGFREFNSVPYEGYAIQAILNLEAFAASNDIRVLSRAILDTVAQNYAYGSMGLRRCVPHRRQWKYGGDMSLAHYPSYAIMQVWTAFQEGEPIKITGRQHQALVAAAMPYRPPNATIALARQKTNPYVLRLGHGAKGSPEIFSGGPGYLLTAGGVCRGKLQEVIPRQTALLLDDDAPTLKECIYLPGAEDWTAWNNTGVYKNFACGNAPVHIPENFEPVLEKDNWKSFAFEAVPKLIVLTYSAKNFGLIVLRPMEHPNAGKALFDMIEANKGKDLKKELYFPEGEHYVYDVDAAPGTWIIASDDKETLNRNYDTWPAFNLITLQN